jgi:hypothetical protein
MRPPASLKKVEKPALDFQGQIKRRVIEPRNSLVVSLRIWSDAGAAPGGLDLGLDELPGHTGVGEQGE